MEIEALSTPVSPADLQGLVALLTDCVHAGASIGFLAPLSSEEASAYWRKVIGDLASGNRVIFTARDGQGGLIIGSAQIAFEPRANGRHRAEVQKVMVLTTRRRQGIADALMKRVENTAQGRRVTLLFLDTSDGHGGARGFYETLNYTYVGGIPDYALDPDGTPSKNAIYYKRLAPAT